MGSFIRYEEPRQLFYDDLVGNTIKVETDKNIVIILFNKKSKTFEYLFTNWRTYKILVGKSFSSIAMNESISIVEEVALHNIPTKKLTDKDEHNPRYLNFICTSFNSEKKFTENGLTENNNHAGQRLNEHDIAKSYAYSKKTPINFDFKLFFLFPPDGRNLIEIIQTYSDLRQEIGLMFNRYGQKLQLRIDEKRLEIIKEQDGIIYSYPYSSVADTLQRIIFYLAAIESNDDAVLLFEEPKAHSFPVYVSKLGRRIMESTNNQFFIDTHSPYLVTEILEDMLTDDEQVKQLAMFAVYYEDHQTKVHQLSDEEMFDIRADGIDVFYNMKRFTTGRADA